VEVCHQEDESAYVVNFSIGKLECYTLVNELVHKVFVGKDPVRVASQSNPLLQCKAHLMKASTTLLVSVSVIGVVNMARNSGLLYTES